MERGKRLDDRSFIGLCEMIQAFKQDIYPLRFEKVYVSVQYVLVQYALLSKIANGRRFRFEVQRGWSNAVPAQHILENNNFAVEAAVTGKFDMHGEAQVSH